MERSGEQLHGLHMQQQQQQQQRPTSVVIVQQPIVVGPATYVRAQPFLRRGVKLNNGTNIGASCITCLGGSGVIMVLVGLIFTIVGVSTFMGIMLMLVGGGMLAACFKFCHKAKQDYDALPQDHPDRVTYATPVFRPHRGGGSAATAYQLPPGTQFITTTPTGQSGGQILSNYQLPPNTQIIGNPAMMQPVGPYPSGNIFVSQPPGAMPTTSPPLQVPPAEDKPPSYDEVCKDGRIQ